MVMQGSRITGFMSSAYVVSVVFFGGLGMSEVLMLKSVGDRTPP